MTDCLEDLAVVWEPSLEPDEWGVLELVWLFSGGVSGAFVDRAVVMEAMRCSSCYAHKRLPKLITRGLVDEGSLFIPRRWGHTGSRPGDLMKVATAVRLTKIGLIEHFDHAGLYRQAAA